jgi:hypothetical protein
MVGGLRRSNILRSTRVVKNRTIASIKPEAALESQEYIDGCILGYHECAIDLVAGTPRGDVNLETALDFVKAHHPTEHGEDWYRGFRDCYAIRRLRAREGSAKNGKAN